MEHPVMNVIWLWSDMVQRLSCCLLSSIGTISRQYMCVCVCACAYACASACVFMCVCVCACAHVCVCMCVCVCVCVNVCVFMCIITMHSGLSTVCYYGNSVCM